MKIFKRIASSIIIIAIALEVGLLSKDLYTYTKYKYANLTLNGRIICEIDNLIHFSK